jgi:hypothetical protein
MTAGDALNRQHTLDDVTIVSEKVSIYKSPEARLGRMRR